MILMYIHVLNDPDEDFDQSKHVYVGCIAQLVHDTIESTCANCYIVSHTYFLYPMFHILEIGS